VLETTANPKPVVAMTRGANVVSGTLVVQPVTSLDPRAAGSAVTSVGTAPDNGFYSPVQYRGAFSPTEHWLCGWSAASAFGMLVAPPGGCNTGGQYRVVIGSFNAGETVAGTLVVSGPPQGNPADLNQDGIVNASDIAILLGNWGGSGVGDIDHDGIVGAQDLAALLGAWG